MGLDLNPPACYALQMLFVCIAAVLIVISTGSCVARTTESDNEVKLRQLELELEEVPEESPVYRGIGSGIRD